MKRITDPTFKYTPSTETDIRKTFARVKREQKAKEEMNKAAAKVRPLVVRTKP